MVTENSVRRANTEVQSSETWKQKYLASLERLECQEKRWAEIESMLRLAVRRLSLAADGVDPVLDRQLAEVRQVVRCADDGARLSRLVDEISQTIKRLEEERSAGEHAVPPPQEALIKLFDSIAWPRGMSKTARKLRRRLEAVNETDSVLGDFARLIADALARNLATTEVAAGGSTEVQHYVGNQAETDASVESSPRVVDHQRKQAVPVSAARVLLDLLDRVHVPDEQISQAQTLRRRIAAAQDARDLCNLTAEVAALLSPPRWENAHAARRDNGEAERRLHEILVQLLGYMAVPDDLLPEARKLEDKLTDKLSSEELTVVLQQIADLVSQLRSRVDKEKREIESFLIQLTDRLQDLGQHLQLARSQQQASLDSSRELDKVVRNQVHDIESSVDQAADLEQLKQAVQVRLDSILNDLDAYRRSEEENHKRMEREVKTLTSRLRGMENEYAELRERAKREHMQAVSDALTGVFNRSAYETRLAQEYARWKRYRTPFALLLWDVDGFKSINDRYGHTAGDNALKLIAGVLRDNLRDADFIARYGGDEFAALLSETDLHTAKSVAAKLHSVIASSSLRHRGTRVPITLSCGIASIRDGDTPETIFERADVALYRTKRDGKNQWESQD